ncbi:hypothetical protein Pfo_028008 [Paulownia fortunei]|nr:hypothetical protein Pfo_028008 [Paulownia fortunei]
MGIKFLKFLIIININTSCIFCGGVSTSILKSPGIRQCPSESISLYRHKNRVFFGSPISHRIWASASSRSSISRSPTKRRSRKNREDGGSTDVRNNNANNKAAVSEETRKKQQQVNDQKNGPTSVRTLYQNGDPLGRRDLGKGVVKWICQGMKAMALDFAMAEMQGDFADLKQRMGPGLTFVIQAQPYLNAVPMPLGLEAICLKTCAHYPTLFDHFQRELRDVLQDLQHKSLIHNWRETESWKLLKELASSAQHRAIARKTFLSKCVHGVLGLDLDKAKAIQCRIDEFTKHMSDLLRIERDAELEFTQEELNAVPTPDEHSSSPKPTEFLVSHGQAEQELCDTICNLNAISTSTGNHRLPPTNLSPGDMVCVRICDSRGAGATSCMQGFVNHLGDDGCSISVALESRHGDPTFSKLFGKNIRIDRIQGLADALTYERNCEALMMLQKKGLQKKNSSIAVVTTIFGDKEDIAWFKQEASCTDNSRAPGTGKTGVLKQLISLVVKQGERVLVTAPTNAAVDNMVEKLSDIGANIVRVGNPARISPAVASKSLVEIVNNRLAILDQTSEQLGKTMKKKERETVREILSSAQVVLATNIGAADPMIRWLNSFDLVVIDEAGQAIEPSCWIPILLGKRCILAGDQCQLAPVILSRKALEGGLGVSFLERASTLHEGVLATKLTTQYRMNDAIASWASKEMYNGLLKSSASVTSHLLSDCPLVKPTWITQCPLLLLDTRMPYGSLSVGCEEQLDPAGTGSFYNEGEADIVVQHVFALIYAGVSPATIVVQSPYVAQVQLLRDRLEEFPLSMGVEVATIDSFQGREADAVIISMVRSNNLGAVGFLGDSRRMNVAITRARKHVAIICDSSTICHNTFWQGGSGGSGLSMNPMLPSVS